MSSLIGNIIIPKTILTNVGDTELKYFDHSNNLILRFFMEIIYAIDV